MKRTMKKMVSMALTGTMAVAVLAGAGTSEVKAASVLIMRIISLVTMT